MSSIYCCSHCYVDFTKLPPMANIQFHLDGRCMPKSEDQYEKHNRLNIIRYTRATDKMFLLDAKIHHEDMVAFGKGWWKGWGAGIISGLLLGAMWTWIAIEVWK